MSDQRGTIKTYALVGKSATEAYNLIKEAYGDLAFSRAYVFDLFKQYKNGRVSIDDERGKCPKPKLRTDENVALVKSLVLADRRVTIESIVSDTDLSLGTVHTILHDDLGFRKVSARWVPRLLTDEHKQQHLEMARNFKRRHFTEGKRFLDSIVTEDESWVHYHTPETKRQSMQWKKSGENAPVKAKVVGSEKKVMLIAFFDSEGMIYQHYVPPKQTVNSAYYISVLTTFLSHLRRKRPAKIVHGWILHHDNARPHTSRETTEFLMSKSIETLYHAPYSPDLAPCDFWLFPVLKDRLAGSKHKTVTEVQTAVQGVLAEITKGGLLFVFEKWVARLDKCIRVEGDYVEKTV
jgi:histone-lysine N-methyltransferase SETMAR